MRLLNNSLLKSTPGVRPLVSRKILGLLGSSLSR